MNRLLNAVKLDYRLQFRNGFYYAAGVVVLLQVVFLSWLPAESLDWLLPVVLLGNILINGFYFIGGLVLLEKAEGSLEAQVVTPLQSHEYLAAKAITLCLLSLIESLIIVGILLGADFEVLPLVAGIVLTTAMLCQFGFLIVARYDSINEYLFPSFVWTLLLSLPLLSYFEVWHNWVFYLHPVQAVLVVLRAAVLPVSAGELIYGVLYSASWVGMAFVFCVHTFHRFVVARAQP